MLSMPLFISGENIQNVTIITNLVFKGCNLDERDNANGVQRMNLRLGNSIYNLIYMFWYFW